MEPQTKNRPESPLDGATEDLENLGRYWAAYGLRVGVAALQTSAVSLTQVASLIGTVADTIRQPGEADETTCA